MKTTRNAAAGMLIVLTLLMAMLAACGSQPSKPGAAGSPRVTPSPSLTPAATAAPGGTTPSRSGTPPPGASSQVVSSRLAYSWHWPNDVARPGRLTHAHRVPPVPQLVRISVGNHPGDHGDRPFNRMSFTFTTAFPSYRFAFADKLTGDPSGKVIPLSGLGVLRISFTGAQAHSADGKRSTIISTGQGHRLPADDQLRAGR